MSVWRCIPMLLAAAFALTPWCGGPLALAIGIVLALTGLACWQAQGRVLSRWLIQVAIVLLGLTIDLQRVADAGLEGMAFAAGTIALVFALGLAVGRVLGVSRPLKLLVCSGTAICGGSAIAATSKVIKADDTETSIAMALIFCLNALALFVLPPAGRAMGLSQGQFGTWAAVAIHDMASVVAAGKAYGPDAVDTATVVKLARVLWIVPMALALGHWAAQAGRTPQPIGGVFGRVRSALPWFIVAFLIASAVRTLAPGLAEAEVPLRQVARSAMALALLLIGAGLSKQALARIGLDPLLLAAAVWLALTGVSLAMVLWTID